VKKLIDELLENFLTRNAKKMVGYAVAQSENYGIRTDRLQSLQTVVEILEAYPNNNFDISHGRNDILGEHPALLEKLLALPFVKITSVLNAAGGIAMAPAIEIIEKKFTYTTRIDLMLTSLRKTLNEYGERAKSFAGQGADWKALSHAIRITEQIIELCETGQLRFPRPNAEYLLKIKQGWVPLEEATNYLHDVFSKIDAAVENSVLQEKTPDLEDKFEAFKIKWLRTFYQI
jgi:hypothetical protein